MQFIFFVAPMKSQRVHCTPKNEGKSVHVPPDEKTCGHAADYILFVLHSFQKTLFRLHTGVQKMQYSEFTLFMLHIRVKQYSDCTVSSLHHNKIPQYSACTRYSDCTVFRSYNVQITVFRLCNIQVTKYSDYTQGSPHIVKTG